MIKIVSCFRRDHYFLDILVFRQRSPDKKIQRLISFTMIRFQVMHQIKGSDTFGNQMLLVEILI